MQPNKTLSVNGEPFEVLRLLGKGKGGYSFLVRSQSHSKTEYVLKQMHHEPMPFLQPNDKVQAEIRDYRRLRELGIRLPAMLDIDIAKERILKEYIDGPTVYDLVLTDQMDDSYVDQVREMAKRLQSHRLNIDYFPTNFVVENGLVYYIDFECTAYTRERSFDGWGVTYWSKTPEFLRFVAAHAPHAPAAAQ
ncbi:protein kinase [Bifidobacterium animalis subsp. lactis]|uniref:Protein kinase n=1 Tax=Bifidobacterium animalis subsp. lactis TaxID=302911 RepID=A0A8B3RIQ4_BIFAN|nr:protein kinase [Bifidobacterium animalis]RYM93852.1 protein kinase [Bifidobacterium animalis subsp. lactis]RYM93900.1 protein kinase [Bifidobacterium animalis subsp. lactis]RYM95825.1 protein kinase [Bifidobacterium animalis subsp. lactis]